jgi:hypothetical protein
VVNCVRRIVFAVAAGFAGGGLAVLGAAGPAGAYAPTPGPSTSDAPVNQGNQASVGGVVFVVCVLFGLIALAALIAFWPRKPSAPSAPSAPEADAER